MGLLDRLRASRTKGLGRAPGVGHGAHSQGQPRFAVIDVETTGLRPEIHRIVEIAVVTTDPWGQVVDEWSTRINPEGPVGATHVHGITADDVAQAPVFAEVIAQLNRRIAGAAVAAHNAQFDLAFLRAEYRRAGWAMPFVPALCTLEASEYHLPRLDRRRLGDCCWAVGTALTVTHTALGDARATAELLAAFMNPHLGLPPLPQHMALPIEAVSVRWPSRPTMATQPLPSAPLPQRQLPPRVLAQIRANASREPASPLVQMIERFSLLDALDEGAPAGSITYLEKLAEVLEDGEVTADETADLAAVAEAMSLSAADVAAANRAFVLTLAHAALDDGKVTRVERAELQRASELLQVNPKLIPALLDHAEHARHVRLSVGLRPLPENWPHGDPLRVGDKVVFTGCDDQIRTALEQRSEELGVRILGTVSPKAALLVTDGSMNGTKAARARDLGTRTVHPDVYAVMLKNLQPAQPRTVKPLPATTTLKSTPRSRRPAR